MKKAVMFLSVIALCVLMAACGKSYEEQAKALVEEAKENYKNWSDADKKDFTKRYVQLIIDFYESEPTIEEYEASEKMWDKLARDAVKDLKLPGGDWSLMFYWDDDDEELNGLYKKFYKVEDEWKKAHRDELNTLGELNTHGDVEVSVTEE